MIETYLLKEIRDVVTQPYLDLENYSHVLGLRNKAQNMRQGDHNVTQYFSVITTIVISTAA